MTKKQRIAAAIAGEQTDTIPYALWTHLPGIDMNPVRLAEETYRFYKMLDVDFIKVMSNGMYPVEDLGCTIDYSEIEKGGVAKLIDTPIHEIEDWKKITATSCEAGALARELTALRLLLDRLRGEEVPVIFTVFSPLTTADKVSGKHLLHHIQNGGGAAVHGALERITQSTCELVRRAIEMGADGVFFATQMSDYKVLDEAVYREFGAPYDKQVLQASNGWCNVVHAHGDSIMFDLLKDYPAQIFNWHVGESLPAIDEGQILSQKCVMGGLKRMDITNRNKNEVRDQIYRSIKALDGRNLILTPGCVIRYPLDEDMLVYVRQAKLEVERMLLPTRATA